MFDNFALSFSSDVVLVARAFESDFSSLRTRTFWILGECFHSYSSILTMNKHYTIIYCSFLPFVEATPKHTALLCCRNLKIDHSLLE